MASGPARESRHVALDPGAGAVRAGEGSTVGVHGHEFASRAHEHRAVPVRRDRHPSGGDAREQVGRVTGGRLHPGGGGSQRGVRPGPVPVAAAHGYGVRVPRTPPGQRGRPAQVEPAPVPHLHQRGALWHGVHPAHRARDGMVDRQQATVALGGLQPLGGRFAEVHPSDIAQRAGVPVARGDLLARDERDPVPAGGAGKLPVVADRVVIGDGEEVQAAVHREPGQLADGERAIGMHRVRVQIARPPPPSAAGREVPARRAVRRRGYARRRLRQASAGLDGLRRQLVRQAARGHLVEADDHLPQPRLDLAGQVAGGGLVGADHIAVPRAPRPAAEIPRPAGPEAAEVQHPGRAVVAEGHPHGGGTGRHLDGKVVPRRGELILKRPLPCVPGGPCHAPI